MPNVDDEHVNRLENSTYPRKLYIIINIIVKRRFSFFFFAFVNIKCNKRVLLFYFLPREKNTVLRRNGVGFV